jgi:hypothetical protein
MVRFTENKRIKPMMSIKGETANKIMPNDSISEKNSSFSMVMPVPKKTINVLKYAKNVRSLASLVRSMANQSRVINGDSLSMMLICL